MQQATGQVFEATGSGAANAADGDDGDDGTTGGDGRHEGADGNNDPGQQACQRFLYCVYINICLSQQKLFL